MSTYDDAPDGVAGSTDSPRSDSPQSATAVPQVTTDPPQSTGSSGYDTAGPVMEALVSEPAPRVHLRVATVVWGLVITAIGIMVLATASGVSFDLGLVMIGLIGFAGIALLIGSIASGIRHRHP
ncbi:MAG TPA: hypothetical protein VMV41_05325 [Cellulomonadaceae bacterium]|nr:hypothetical protein [Cellulomonadaceae bacterium]